MQKDIYNEDVSYDDNDTDDVVYDNSDIVTYDDLTDFGSIEFSNCYDI